MGRLAREVRALFQLPSTCMSWTLRRLCSMCPQPHQVSTDRGSCPLLYLHLLAGTSGKFPGRRPLHMPRPYSSSQEENNPPKRDQPCLLAESIVELRREVGFYLSFTDEEVFRGVELPQEERSSLSVPTAPTADVPGDIDTPEMPPISEVAPKYARWNMVIHPS